MLFVPQLGEASVDTTLLSQELKVACGLLQGRGLVCQDLEQDAMRNMCWTPEQGWDRRVARDCYLQGHIFLSALLLAPGSAETGFCSLSLPN